MSSMLSIGAAGMQAAADRFQAAASQVVRAGTTSANSEATAEVDLATAMVSMTLASYDFKASVKIATVGRDVMQATLDMLA
jgi:hypothetical protein